MKASKTIFSFFAISLPVMCFTPILTSCTIGKENTYCNQIVIREYVGDESTYYPVYATPSSHKEKMAPNFLEIWNVEGIKYDSSITWINETTGWLNDSCISNLTYQQLFLNTNVCAAFNVQPSTVVGSLDSLYNTLSIFTKWDLSQVYEKDKYADETVKALNNPWFYSSINGSSIVSNVTEIDLHDNDLWYIPFFGYCETSSTPWIYGKDESNYIGFKSLEKIDLRDNEITTLPHINSKTLSDKQDLTRFTDTNPNFLVYVDNNHMTYNFSTSTLASYNYQFYNHSAIAYTVNNKNDTIQSYALYQNQDYIKNQLNEYVKSILGQDVNPQKINLDSYSEDLQASLSTTSKDEKFTVGLLYAQIIVDYFNNNNLFSGYIYSELTGLPEILYPLIEGTDYAFCYPEYSTNKGKIDLSFDLGDPRIVKETFNEEGDVSYNVVYPASDTESFIATTINGYCVSGWTSIFMIVIFLILGVAIIVILFYFVYFKHYLSNKRRRNELLKIKKIEQDMIKKGDK